MNAVNTGNESYIKYYATFLGYNHPLKLANELSVEEIATRENSYYVGYFSDNLLLKVEKFFNGKIEFSYQYTYNASGKPLKVIIKRDDQVNEVKLALE